MATNRAETATSYAALILADADIAITADKLMTLIRAAAIEDVEPIWATLFAKALEGKDLGGMMLRVGQVEDGKEGEGVGGKVVEGGKEGQGEEGAVVEIKDGDWDGSDDGDLGMGLFDF
jgi:large subunit ribosomal protein LP1